MYYTNEFSENLPTFLKKIKSNPHDPDHEDYEIHCFLKENDVRVHPKESEICKFLKGKSIFITGGTGFLGRLLIEKLLRSCIDIDSIYLLMRPKKEKDLRTRITELYSDVVFEKLNSIHPNYKNKIQFIDGDASLPRMGINEADRNLLIKKVNIIFHAAATTRFDESLKQAVHINIKGTQELIKLAKECQHLVSFVHVSTAFANCTRSYIKEKVYEPLIQPDVVMSMVDSLSKEQLDEITPKLLGKMPNTYALTKQLAEYIIQTEATTFPVCIYRPSIVISTFREPIKSWADNIYGPLGLVIAIITGLVRCMPATGKKRCDVVPADYVINGCIASAYKTAKTKESNILVYNCTTQKENPILWDDMNSEKNHKRVRKIGTTNLVRFPYFVTIKSYILFTIVNFLSHHVFAYAMDCVSFLVGKKPRLVKVYKKIDKFIKAVSFFWIHEFDFETKNINGLWESLSEEDKTAFPFSMRHIDWDTYLTTFLVGLRVYLLKENLDNLEEARSTVRRAFYIYLTYNTIIYGVILLCSYKLLSALFNTFIF